MNSLASISILAIASTLLAGTACYSADAVTARPAALGSSETSEGDDDGDDALDAGRKDASKKKDATPSPVDQEEEEEAGAETDASSGLADASSGLADASSGLADANSGLTDASVAQDAGPSGPTGPTFTSVYTTVIGVSCVGCHGPTHVTGLNMRTKTAAYGNLVGIKAGNGGTGSCNDGVRTRVVAGDASASLLFRKIAHTNDCGSGMPLGGAKLSKTKVALVQGWINAGALND